jgi:hypothetical protein
LKAINESCDLAFVSSESDRELSGGDPPGFHATKKHTGFLRGHPKSQEAAVE